MRDYAVDEGGGVQQVERDLGDIIRHHHWSLRVSQQHLLVGVVVQHQGHQSRQRAHGQDRLEENHRDVQ